MNPLPSLVDGARPTASRSFYGAPVEFPYVGTTTQISSIVEDRGQTTEDGINAIIWVLSSVVCRPSSVVRPPFLRHSTAFAVTTGDWIDSGCEERRRQVVRATTGRL